MSLRATVLLGGAALGCSCVAGNDPVQPRNEVMRPMGAPEAEPAVELTPTAARASVAVPSFPTPPEVVLVTVARIHNPRAQSFMITLELAGPDRTDAVPIGTFTPYPPDRGGGFMLSIPRAAAQRLLAPSTPVLWVTLGPVDAEQPLVEPLTVAVAPPEWRSTAP